MLSILVFLMGCRKEDEKSDYKVSGILISDGKPLDNALVDINGLEQYKATTNAKGYFLIEHVPAGSHSLNNPLSPFKILDDTGWLYFSKTFTSDSESNAVFYITSQVEKVSIDNLEIKITE